MLSTYLSLAGTCMLTLFSCAWLLLSTPQTRSAPPTPHDDTMKFQHIHLLTALLLAPGNTYVALVGATCPPPGEDPALWVDCRGGNEFNATGATGRSCFAACSDGTGIPCCTSSSSCGEAFACIKKDGSCDGPDACARLLLSATGGPQPAISGPSCVGDSSCDSLGAGAAPVPDFITKSCVGFTACAGLGFGNPATPQAEGSFGNVLSSCNGNLACEGVNGGGSLNGSCNGDSVYSTGICESNDFTTPQACNSNDAPSGQDCFVDTTNPLTPDGICDGAGQCVNVPSAAPSDEPSLSSQPSDMPSDMPSDEPSMTKGTKTKAESTKAPKSSKMSKQASF
mmetsp:Transcript_3810/g.8878  ORF Transcript_3810/g.8878 Transcript_3810/m.8878 type:complete len:339 (+) Transcript_3810:141-1157(+)